MNFKQNSHIILTQRGLIFLLFYLNLFLILLIVYLLYLIESLKTSLTLSNTKLLSLEDRICSLTLDLQELKQYQQSLVFSKQDNVSGFWALPIESQNYLIKLVSGLVLLFLFLIAFWYSLGYLAKVLGFKYIIAQIAAIEASFVSSFSKINLFFGQQALPDSIIDIDIGLYTVRILTNAQDPARAVFVKFPNTALGDPFMPFERFIFDIKEQAVWTYIEKSKNNPLYNLNLPCQNTDILNNVTSTVTELAISPEVLMAQQFLGGNPNFS